MEKLKNYSLYDFPELYDSLRTPDRKTFNQVYELICDYLGRKPKSVMDPACGPATWLAHFAKRGILVAGNDICPDMIENAKEKCGRLESEFIVGDMCDLQFKKSPYEVVLEIAGTCGLLADEDKFRCFLDNVIKHTASDGLILLTIFFIEEPAGDYPCLVDEWGPVEVFNGQAWISYEVVGCRPDRSIDFVRRTVRTTGIEECPQPLIDEYEMFSWEPEQFWKLLSEYSQLEFLTAFRHNDPSGITVNSDLLYGETTIVLRKKCE